MIIFCSLCNQDGCVFNVILSHKNCKYVSTLKKNALHFLASVILTLTNSEQKAGANCKHNIIKYAAKTLVQSV